MNLLLISIISILFPCAFLFLFERYFKEWTKSISAEVVGIYFNFIGVLFTLLLAFVVVAAWEDYDNAVHTVENEAHKLMYVYEDALELSENNKTTLQTKIVDYTNSVINNEWNNMGNTESVKQTKNKFHALMELKRLLMPLNDTDKEILANIDSSLDDLKQIRHDREGFFESHVPDLLWGLLFGGSFICFLFSCAVPLENIYWKMVMCSIVSFSMTIVLYLTFCLSNPYSGQMKISSDDYKKVLERIEIIGK